MIVSTDQQAFSVTILVKVSNDIINQAPTAPRKGGWSQQRCLYGGSLCQYMKGMISFDNRFLLKRRLYKKVSVSKVSDRFLIGVLMIFVRMINVNSRFIECISMKMICISSHLYERCLN